MRPATIRDRFFFGRTSAERRFGVVLLLVVVGLGVLLSVGGSEWRESAGRRMEKAAAKYAKEGREFADAEERGLLLFKSLRREHFVKTGLWWAALVNLVLALGLFFTRPLWVGRDDHPAPVVAGPGPPGRRFWIAVMAAVVVAGILRAPRMDLSLYNDEAYNFRQYIHGQFKVADDGGSEFEAAGWGDTFWRNKANNGVPFSALAKLAQGRVAPGEIRESRLRLPALVSGLLSIGVVAWLGFQLFGGAAGVAAAWLLAVHPWHLRYSTEARPYGMVILFAALLLLCLLRALRGNRWRWWLGFGACQFALIWSFAGALYYVLGVNLAALFAIVRRGGASRWAALGRLAASGLLSAMLYLQLMAPNFPQMAHTLSETDSLHGTVDPGLVVDILAYLATGMPATDQDPANAHNPALAKLWPVRWWLLVPGLLALAAVGASAVRALRARRESWVLAWGVLLAFAIALAASAASGGMLYRWYTIYLLPFAALVLAAGWAAMWGSRRLRPAAIAVVVAVSPLIFWPARDYIGHPKEDLRGIAALAGEGGAISAGFWTDSGVYDPGMRRVRDLADLQALIGEAQREGRTLRVATAHRRLALGDQPECVHLLESAAFKKLAEFPGLEEEQFTATVYEWTGGE